VDIISEFQSLVDLIEDAAQLIDMYSSSILEEGLESSDYVDPEIDAFMSSLFVSHIDFNSFASYQKAVLARVKNIKDKSREADVIISKLECQRWVSVVNQNSQRVKTSYKIDLDRFNSQAISEEKFKEIQNAVFVFHSFVIMFNECIKEFNRTHPYHSPLLIFADPDIVLG
jgi:hypothetical protein